MPESACGHTLEMSSIIDACGPSVILCRRGQVSFLASRRTFDSAVHTEVSSAFAFEWLMNVARFSNQMVPYYENQFPIR
jgi:hypothetical protein